MSSAAALVLVVAPQLHERPSDVPERAILPGGVLQRSPFLSQPGTCIRGRLLWGVARVLLGD